MSHHLSVRMHNEEQFENIDVSMLLMKPVRETDMSEMVRKVSDETKF